MGSSFNINLFGRKFGSLTVVQKQGFKKQGKTYEKWECLCSCGNKTKTDSYNLLKGVTTTCGPKHSICMGKKYGKLTVIKRLENNTNNQNKIWLCSCDCGKERKVKNHYLTSGKITDCGCGRVKYEDRSIPAKNKLFSGYKRGAKIRNIEFNLSFDLFIKITSSNCFYCTSPPNNIIKDNKKGTNLSTYVYNGIDRKDNSKSYDVGNCLPCCFDCNFAKSNKTFDEFMSWALRVGSEVDNIKQKLLKLNPGLIIS